MESGRGSFCQRAQKDRNSSTEFKVMTTILSLGSLQTDGPTSKERSCHTGGATDPVEYQDNLQKYYCDYPLK